jgi:hypothetical protein
MTDVRKIAKWAVAVLSLAILIGSVLFIIRQSRPKPPLQLTGVVLRRDTDPRKQIPLADAEVTATTASTTTRTLSDASGFFSFTLPPREGEPQVAKLAFAHSEYVPFDISEATGNQLYLAYMTPLPEKMILPVTHKVTTLSNVRVRYTEKATVTNNIGPLVKPFQVVNTGNIPCDQSEPCSPDHKWKATIYSFVEQGHDHVFRHPRLACIAGPCPFTRIESPDLVEDAHDLKISVRNWSDTATFLLEAEVSQTRTTDVVRQSYPTEFGSSMSFILPASAQGPSVEADVDGQPIVFPLGPDLLVSWGTCSVKVAPDKTRAYRCDLKAGYRFPPAAGR